MENNRSHICRGSRTVAAALASWTLLASTGLAEPGEFRDTASHEELVARLRQAEQQDPMKNLPPSTGEDPAKKLPDDLISQSDVISFSGIATLVPKRAILRIPPNFADRLQYRDGSRIVGWLEFQPLNRGWITTVEVTLAQAEGKEPLSEAVEKMLSTTRNLVIATYQGGPISVLDQVPAGDSAGAVRAGP